MYRFRSLIQQLGVSAQSYTRSHICNMLRLLYHDKSDEKLGDLIDIPISVK